MNDSTHILSHRLGDYQKVRAETVSLVNAVSNSMSGFGNIQAGISLIYPAENLTEDGKAFTRIYFMSPMEIVKGTLDETAIGKRLREIVATTPIHLDAKKKQETFLDVKTQEYIGMQHRLVQIIAIACQNFRRDIGELVTLFDGFTQPHPNMPVASSFHIRAAFDNRELLNAYRAANKLPKPPEPSLTPEARELLTRRGVSTHGIPDRADTGEADTVEGLLHTALPVNPSRLRQSAQGSGYGKEVEMVLHVLGEAIVAGEIPPIVMDQRFRQALTELIEEARNQPAGDTGGDDIKLAQ